MRKDSLKHLEIEDCKNLTDEGLRSLKELNLRTLSVKILPLMDHKGTEREFESM